MRTGNRARGDHTVAFFVSDAADDHDHAPRRPPTSATCCTSTPTGCRRFDAELRRGARLLPGGDRRALHGGAAARRRPGRAGPAATAQARALLDQYVNDRPYVASSFLSVAIAQRLRHGAGRAAARTGRSWPTRRSRSRRGSPSLPVRGRRGVPAAAVRAARLRGRGDAASRSTSAFPEWGDEPRTSPSRCAATCRLARPADAPLRADPGARRRQALLGRRRRDREAAARAARAGWPAHPERELIAAPLPEAPAPARARGARPAASPRRSRAPTRTPSERDGRGGGASSSRCSLNEQRLGAVVAALRAAGATRVLDLGCGEGKLLARAARRARSSSEIVGVDVSLARARDRRSAGCSSTGCRRGSASAIKLLHGSLIYRDRRLDGLRRRRRRRGHRAPRPAAAARRSSACVFEFARPGDRRPDDAEPRVQRAVRERCRPGSSATATTASSGRAPSSQAWADGVARALRLRGALPAGRARGRRASARRRRWRCSRDERSTLTIPELSLVVLDRPRPARASPRSRASTSCRPRSSRRTPAAGWSPTTRTTRRRPNDAFEVLHFIAGEAAGRWAG